ncbi:MAG TPA: TniQ family protein [Ferrovibrio sp.]|uniref:TniQ family protein n=1 Tax=Ferrovibrio sp. TaxID=1917215 RepID=UPI002ED407EE
MTNQAALLSVAPQPEPDESLLGYVLRLTQLNGLPKSSWLFRTAGLPLSDHSLLATYPWDLTMLAACCGVESGRLERMAYWPTKAAGELNFLGHGIREDLVTVRHRRVCGRCLLDRPYHQAIWDLSVMTVCPRHGCYLDFACRFCGRQLNWRAEALTRCSCGRDYSGAPTRAAPIDVVETVKMVSRTLSPDSPAAKGDWIWLAYQLGWLATGGNGLGRPIGFLEIEGDTSGILAAGMAGAVGNFTEFLDRMMAFGPAGETHWRLARTFRLVSELVSTPQKAAKLSETRARMLRG